jgi:hypothetical protein
LSDQRKGICESTSELQGSLSIRHKWIQQFHKWHHTSSSKQSQRWVKITTLKSQVLDANFSQLEKLGLQTPFGQTAAASNHHYLAKSIETYTTVCKNFSFDML